MNYKLIEKHMANLQDEDKLIWNLMLDDEENDDKVLEEEKDTVIQYDQKWMNLEIRVNYFLNSLMKNIDAVHDNSSEKGSLPGTRGCRLPKLDLKKIDGSWLEWLGWWAQFSTIHEDSTLSNVDKFQYLVQSMKENTRASRLVRSYPTTNPNSCLTYTSLSAHFAIRPIGNQNWELPLQALVVNKMTGLLPNRDLRLPITEKFRDIQLADPKFTKSGRIDIILGADVYGLLLLPDNPPDIIHPNFVFYAHNWVLSSLRISGSNSSPYTSAPRIISILPLFVNWPDGKMGKVFNFLSLGRIDSIDLGVNLGNRDTQTLEHVPIKICKKSHNTLLHLGEHLTSNQGPSSTKENIHTKTESNAEKPDVSFAGMHMALERRLVLNDQLGRDYYKFMEEYEGLGHMTQLTEIPVGDQVEHYDLRDGMALRDELIELLRCGGFTLKKWSSNDPMILGNIAKEHCAQKITFEQSKSLEKTSVITKREMLSFIAKLYYPLGWLAPVLVTGKMMVQRLWMAELHWDDPMDESLIETWTKFRKELNFIGSLRIPRWLGLGRNTQGVQLHGFGDASEDAYAAAVYIRIPTDDGVSVKLLASKTKLAPIRKMSIPRLELCAALLLTRLMKYILEELNIKMESATCWSDSTIVLSWIRTMSRNLPTFIGNRVAEIQSCPQIREWRYVPTGDNPADIASRGILGSELKQSSIWWTGPTWLSAESTEWPRKLPVFENQSQTELLSVHAISETPFLVAIGEMSSTFNGYIRKVAWILRFCHNCRYSAERYQSHLTTAELRNAHRRILQSIQFQHFREEIRSLTTLGSVKRTSKIYGLTPFLDDQGILRVGGRLKWAPSMTYEQKHPALLPSSGQVAQMIVQAVHMRTLHGSVHLMLSTIRQKYWMLRAIDQVKRCIRECVTCCRYNRVTQGQLMSDLPKERLTPGKPFSISGVDYAGPVNLRLSKGRGRKTEKGYICLFVCFLTRAVHLELVTDASTPTFMSAFKRFVARRGHCTRLYSDQGTNFVGAARQLRSCFYLAQNQLKELAAVLANDGTEWRFNPPGAPHFGDLWEAGVKALKYHMRRIIGNNLLTYEELLTVLVQIESCLNSRPLYSMKGRENVNDEERAGRPSTSTTDEKINEVEKMILANRRITVREVAEDLNISIGSCHSIFINDLGMRRVAAKLVPKLLNCDQKQHRMNIANEMLDSVRDDPNLLQRVITGDVAGVMHHEFFPQGRRVNKEFHLQVMRNLREAICQKRPDWWKNKNWLLHHDNAPAHTSLLVREFLAKNNTLMMPQPPYSPYLAPCDFSLFPKLKRPMKGRRYATLDEIKTASKEELKKIFKK
ncbi:hypothetical protein LAZ67_X004615 [Cordylochernes scorpioides]|uniref:Integrase catalytic domain-containing protein n=1 Tax=Cordylochernes scorpioides TaxID=51811 RepID=A0ABY6LXC6_9ARAC|nr:hypothetical protein LAZ67_X004615 [Cordylochernes scorpioides]